MQYNFKTKGFNPLFWWIRWALKNDNIRFIWVYGGSSAAKTDSISSALSLEMEETKCSTMVFRKFGVDIKDSVYSDFKEVARRMKLNTRQKYQTNLIKSVTDAKIRFRGMDDEEKVKGIKGFRVLYYNELTQFLQTELAQGRKRLRGMKGQKIIGDWNPISAKHWIKEEVIDKEEWIDMPLVAPNAPKKYSSLSSVASFVKINKKGNSLLIKTTYLDNYWVVGHPSGEGGFLDKHTIEDFEWDKEHKYNYYRIYGLGEWGVIRSGDEFWKQFDETRHVKPLKVDPSLTIHLSIDENVNPYVTVAAWQVHTKDKELRQVHELPCKSPDNNAPKAAKKTAAWLRSIEYKDVVYIYGDPSAGKRSTVDENNRSFFDKFIEVLKAEGFHVVSRVARSAPQVALSAAFINEIYEHHYEGWSIVISDSCKVSIDDYCTVKEDKDGKMLKEKIKDPQTGVTYEPIGHFSDQKRYFITTLLAREFDNYKAPKKRAPVAVPR